jgi:hypothetical protein
MKGHCEFHDSEAGGKMTAMNTHHIYDELSEFIAYLMQLVPVNLPQVFREPDTFKQWTGFDFHLRSN